MVQRESAFKQESQAGIFDHDRFLQARPIFTQALNNLGVVLTAQGFAAEAHSMLQASLAADPGYAEAWNNLGVLQRDLGQVKEALDSYQHAIDLAPGARNASQNRLLALNYIHPGETPNPVPSALILSCH